MKTLRFFLCVSLILTACSIAPTENENFLVLTKSSYETSSVYAVNKQQALSFIDTSKFSKCNILISKDVVTPNTAVDIYDDNLSPDYHSWLVFVDLYPDAYWAHDCIYYYVNASTGDVVSSERRFPPTLLMDTIKCINPKISSTQPTLNIYGREIVQNRNSTNKDYTKWAVILGGSYADGLNGSSIKAECSELYITLSDTYSYSEDQIIVLYTEPSITDFDYDALPDKDYDFTKANVNTVFNTLSSSLATGDTLSIFVMTHGETLGNNESAIILWDRTYLTDSEFAQQINKIPEGIPVNVIMGQCFSGGFIDNLFMRCNYIATACSANETSWRALDTDRSVFYMYWIEAMNYFNSSTVNLNIDTNGDKIITFSEAYTYTNSQYPDDEYAQLGIQETRCESSIAGYGETAGLSRILTANSAPVQPPLISGPLDVGIGENVVYVLSNIPENVQVNWNYPGQLFTEVSRFRTSNRAFITLCADGANVTTTNLSVSVSYPGTSGNVTKTVSNITVWKPGINISDNLIVGNLTSSGGTVQLVSNFSGAYGYNWYNDRNWMVMSQGLYFAEFTNLYRDDNQYVTVSVDFTNPLGDPTTFVRTFTLN